MPGPECAMRQSFVPLCLSLLLAGQAHGQVPATTPTDEAATLAAAERTVLFVPEASLNCADGPLSPVASDAFNPTLWAQTFATLPVGQRIERAAYDFSISPEGRPLSIRPVTGEGFSRLGVAADAQTQATFASSVFPAVPRQDCRLTLRLTPTPLSSADPATVVHFYADARPRDALRSAVERRLRRPGDDCDRPPPRSVAYPDYLRADRPRPGSRSWSAVRWDLRDDGTTTNIAIVGSSGDPVLDDEVRQAVAASVFRSGSVRGCLATFWRNGPNLPMPPVNRDPQDDPLERCDEAFSSRFTPGRLTYPPAFEARGIEGWARVRFDAATWGEIGNVTVVEVQPAAAFSEPAARIVTTGRVTPSFEAAIRCVVPIIFQLPDEHEPERPDLTGALPAAMLPPISNGGPDAPF